MHSFDIPMGARQRGRSAGLPVPALGGAGRSVLAHTEECVFPYAVEEVFDLIADVESYPSFLPYWRRATVTRRENDAYHTIQEVGLGPVCKRFESRTRLERPRCIEITGSTGLCQKLRIEWKFESITEHACRVVFSQECVAGSPALQTILEVMFHDVGRSALQAFKKRARDVLECAHAEVGAAC